VYYVSPTGNYGVDEDEVNKERTSTILLVIIEGRMNTTTSKYTCINTIPR
jgi:hypothetical protein